MKNKKRNLDIEMNNIEVEFCVIERLSNWSKVFSIIEKSNKWKSKFNYEKFKEEHVHWLIIF